MWQRFTERARRVVFFAQEEAARLGENYVGTEHLLLAITRESDSVASRILEMLGVPLDRVRADTERQTVRGHGSLGQDMQLTPRCKRVIDLAYEEARALNNNYIGTEHLLLGLIREEEGLGARVLIKLGASLERTRMQVGAMQEGGLLAERPGQAGDRTTKLLQGVRENLRAQGRMTPEVEQAWDRIENALAEGRDTEELSSFGVEGVAVDAVRSSALEALHGLAESVDTPIRSDRSLAIRAADSARLACEGLTDLISVGDLDPISATALLHLARILKRTSRVYPAGHGPLLNGATLALVFEKPSLRTRVTFDTGMYELGGHTIHLGPADIGMGKRESVADVARNLERWVGCIAARTFSHESVVELAAASKVPVINALSEMEHPCQALADFMTLKERRGKLEGLKIAYVGDGNNVANSLILLSAKLGVHLTLACPSGYEPDAGYLEMCREDAERTASRIQVVQDPGAAVEEADAIYTDVWTSMGQEDETERREQTFRPYQVNAELLAKAKPDAIVLHCLPAHRGLEITDEVMDGPQSAVFDQAENRLHAQKAILAVLMS